MINLIEFAKAAGTDYRPPARRQETYRRSLTEVSRRMTNDFEIPLRLGLSLGDETLFEAYLAGYMGNKGIQDANYALHNPLFQRFSELPVAGKVYEILEHMVSDIGTVSKEFMLDAEKLAKDIRKSRDFLDEQSIEGNFSSLSQKSGSNLNQEEAEAVVQALKSDPDYQNFVSKVTTLVGRGNLDPDSIQRVANMISSIWFQSETTAQRDRRIDSYIDSITTSLTSEGK